MGKQIRIKYPDYTDYISRVSFIDKQDFIKNISTYISKDETENTSKDPYGMSGNSLHFVTLGTILQIVDVETEEILFEKDFGNLYEYADKIDDNLPHLDICNYFGDKDPENTVYRFAEVEEGSCSTDIYIPDGEEFDIRKLTVPAVGIWGNKAVFVLKHPTYNSDMEGNITACDFDTADDFANEADWNYYVPGITTEYPLPSWMVEKEIKKKSGDR